MRGSEQESIPEEVMECRDLKGAYPVLDRRDLFIIPSSRGFQADRKCGNCGSHQFMEVRVVRRGWSALDPFYAPVLCYTCAECFELMAVC